MRSSNYKPRREVPWIGEKDATKEGCERAGYSTGKSRIRPRIRVKLERQLSSLCMGTLLEQFGWRLAGEGQLVPFNTMARAKTPSLAWGWIINDTLSMELILKAAYK